MECVSHAPAVRGVASRRGATCVNRPAGQSWSPPPAARSCPTIPAAAARPLDRLSGPTQRHVAGPAFVERLGDAGRAGGRGPSEGCRRWGYAATSRSRTGGGAAGRASRRPGKRCMGTVAGFAVSGAAGCCGVSVRTRCCAVVCRWFHRLALLRMVVSASLAPPCSTRFACPAVRRLVLRLPTPALARSRTACSCRCTRAVRLRSRLRNSWGWRLGAVLNSPGKHPFALDRRLDAGSGGPAARREVEVGLFRRVADRASEHRWVTDAGRAPRGVAGGALVMSPGVRAGRR